MLGYIIFALVLLFGSLFIATFITACIDYLLTKHRRDK